MTDRELSILRHAIGLRVDGTGRPYRNHFVTGPGSTDYDCCCELADRGLMRRHKGNAITGGDYWFSVTDQGKRLAGESA